MPDQEASQAPVDWAHVADLAATVGPLVAPVVIRVVGELAKRRDKKLNRYEVAVAVDEPVTKVYPILEEMVDDGIVVATGDSANERQYELR
jgi:hypothetical protein